MESNGTIKGKTKVEWKSKRERGHVPVKGIRRDNYKGSTNG